MFFRKITSRGKDKEYTYLKLIENYREGDKVKQRVIANLGNLESLTPEKVETLISGLSRICGLPHGPGELEAKKVLRFGEVMAIHKVWEMLEMPAVIREAFSGKKVDLNIPLLLELMTINQVIKPQNKQAISEWYKTLYLPEAEEKELLPHHFYRVLEEVAAVKEPLERKIYKKLTGLNGLDSSVAFCRLVTGIFEPAPRTELNISAYGKYFLEEPVEQKKVDFGVLATRDGMPFGHRVFNELTGEREFKSTVDYLRETYQTEHCIFVGERGTVTNQGLELLIAHGYDYLVGYKVWLGQDRELLDREFTAGLRGFEIFDDDLLYKEVKGDSTRHLLCYSPRLAEQKISSLQERLAAIEKELESIRKSVGPNNPNYRETLKNATVLKDKNARQFFDWEFNESSFEFNYSLKDRQVEQERKTAGVFILKTNSLVLSGGEILRSYTNLTQIAEALKEIQSFEFKPNQHYAESNISAHIFVCILAAALEKTLEKLIKMAGINLNSRQALVLLEDIKIAINQLNGQEVKSVTAVQKAQADILRALGVESLQRTIV